MKINYKDAINFIEDEMDIKLLEYQKKTVKAIIENNNVFMPRGGGMSTLLKGIGEYFIKISKGLESYDAGRYDPYEYDVIISVDEIIDSHRDNQELIDNQLAPFFIKQQKMNKKNFIKEFDILDQFKG